MEETHKQTEHVEQMSLLRQMVENLEILTHTIKEDRAYRLPSKYNGFDVKTVSSTTTTTDTRVEFTEPIVSLTISVPNFNSAAIVYVGFESYSQGVHAIRLTPSQPNITLTDLPIRIINISSDVAGAYVQIIGLRGE